MITSALNNKVQNNIPGYSFVFIDGCSCAIDKQLATAFNVLGQDQAFTGWMTPIYQFDSLWESTFTEFLTDGLEVEDAFLKTEQKLKRNSQFPESQSGVLAIPKTYGDPQMTLSNRAYHGRQGDWINMISGWPLQSE